MLEGSNLISSNKKKGEVSQQAVLDPVPTGGKTEDNTIKDKIAKSGLKGTTQRDGGSGNILDDQKK